MRMHRIVAGLVIALLTGATPALAQNFKGTGPEATAKFSLGEGLAIFEVQHDGEGAFLITLLDENGNVIVEVARGSGPFGGSKAVRIERTGLYLFNVDAAGEWSVRLRSDDEAPTNGATAAGPAAERGNEAGYADASRVGTSGWIARGFLGGVLLGPIGTGVAIAKAASSAENDAVATADRQPMEDLSYATAWRQAYAERLRMRRQRSALIGGAAGTTVLLIALLQLVDLGGVSETDGLGGEGAVIVVPIRF